MKQIAPLLLLLAVSAPIGVVAQNPAPQPPASAFQQPGSPPPVAAPAPVAQPFESWRFNPRERTARGLAAWENQKPADAVAPMDTAARLKPADPLAAYNSGTAHLGAGLADAEPILLRALQSAPAALATDAHYNLGNARLAAHKPAEAIDSYKETLRRSPGHAGARRNLELALRMLEEQQKQQQQQQQQPNPQGESPDQPPSKPDPGAGSSSQDPSQQEPSQGEGQPEPSQGQQGAGAEQRQRPLPQFRDQEDMTAEQAAAILQAVDNLERERRREEAKERALAKSSVEKDW